MLKNFGYRTDGSYWSIWNLKTYCKICDDFIGDFYPFPTLKLSLSEDTFETDDHEFGICITWGFWELRLSYYWGKDYERAYKRRIIKKEGE